MQIEDKGTVEPSKMYFAMTNEFAKKHFIMSSTLAGFIAIQIIKLEEKHWTASCSFMSKRGNWQSSMTAALLLSRAIPLCF